MRFLFICLLIVAAAAVHPGTRAKADAPSATSVAATRRAELDVLKLEEGVWDAAIEFPSQTPGGAPTRASGVQTNTFVTGNGWIKNDFTVDAKYGGHGTWGYDAEERQIHRDLGRQQSGLHPRRRRHVRQRRRRR